jgi:hypothetical protein
MARILLPNDHNDTTEMFKRQLRREPAVPPPSSTELVVLTLAVIACVGAFVVIFARAAGLL